MKAIVHTKYGPPDVLQLREVERPVPKDDEVLIRVRATTVNRTDTAFLRARPFLNRFFTGLLRPRATVPGSELAGEVEAVGKGVRSFKPGDQVFGLTKLHLGAHAEYVCLSEAAPITQKLATMDFEQAAAVCDGAMLAMGFVKNAGLRAGQRVLVYGASGSIGTATVQLAKYYGAEVTAACDTRNLELVRSLGADAVIDYTA
jgi:NADPH:quinone reductase-like Zn-dependent oxidoreductase